MSATTEQLITMTPEAVAQLKKFLAEQGTPDHALRVFVAPGGCSGLQYGMTIEETAEEDDTVRLELDANAAECLEGVAEKEIFGFGVDRRAPAGAAQPGPADFKAAVARADIEVTRAADCRLGCLVYDGKW